MEIVESFPDDIVTVYFQGLFVSRTQATKYTGQKGLDIRVGKNQIEHVFNPDSPEILHNIYLSDELSDISFERSYNPCHWLCGMAHFLYNIRHNIYGTSSIAHNLMTRINIAGPEDVDQYYQTIKSCIRDFPKKKIVLFGPSRGAATLFVTMTRLSEEERNHIKMVIVEAPFSSVESLLSLTCPSFAVNPLLVLLETLTQFDRTQTSPMNAIQSELFPLTIPLLFITSEKDKIVPVQETKKLIDYLKNERQHRYVSHLELQHSSHSGMSLENQEDRDRYQKEVYSHISKL